jgi:8-oxo-dGTP pyrophosphatase MutT (NUDIX family)
MEEANVMKKIRELGTKLPHFPDGRIDYTNTSYAPVVCVFIRFNGEIFLVKRGGKVSNYQEKWNVITGYIDRVGPLEQKARDEVEEETGITSDLISEVISGKPYELPDNEIKKIWLVCPFVVELNSKPEIRLDFESTEFRWIKPNELKLFDAVSGLEKSYSACLKNSQA